MERIKSIVIYNKESLHDFNDYGIEIPLLNARVENTIEFLKKTYMIEPSVYPSVDNTDLELVHTDAFLEKVKNEPNNIVIDTYELKGKDGSFNRYSPVKAQKPLTNFIEKAKMHVAGTYFACTIALNSKFSYHLGGGMHHAMSFRPGGFCMFNDIAIAARKLQRIHGVKQILIIDLDCHKGDGTAEIFQVDESVFTFSIHMKDGWPLSEVRFNQNGELNPSFIESDLDVPVRHSDNYLDQLKSNLNSINLDEFDFAIVIHGVDVFEGDTLESSAGIQLSKEEVLERDLLVYKLLLSNKCPQTWCLGGGYGPRVHELYIQFLDEILQETISQ